MEKSQKKSAFGKYLFIATLVLFAVSLVIFLAPFGTLVAIIYLTYDFVKFFFPKYKEIKEPEKKKSFFDLAVEQFKRRNSK